MFNGIIIESEEVTSKPCIPFIYG